MEYHEYIILAKAVKDREAERDAFRDVLIAIRDMTAYIWNDEDGGAEAEIAKVWAMTKEALTPIPTEERTT